MVRADVSEEEAEQGASPTFLFPVLPFPPVSRVFKFFYLNYILFFPSRPIVIYNFQIMMQTCHPRCDVPLPEIGNARVMTAFEACQAPPELTIKIIVSSSFNLN